MNKSDSQEQKEQLKDYNLPINIPDPCHHCLPQLISILILISEPESLENGKNNL